MRGDAGNGNPLMGCLVVIVMIVLGSLLFTGCVAVFGDEDNVPSNQDDQCYYTDPIPHYDDCRS